MRRQIPWMFYKLANQGKELLTVALLKNSLKLAWILLGFALIVLNNFLVFIGMAFGGEMTRERFTIIMMPGWAYAVVSLWPAVKYTRRGGLFVRALWINIILIGFLPVGAIIKFGVPEALRWIREIV